MRVLHSVVVAFTIVCTRAHLAYWAPNPLQTVQGLYVKPSGDGQTGDLYVAATEDNGVNSQWVADKPINFLTQPQSLTYSSSYASNASPGEEVVSTQKRAVFAGPSTKYSYGTPAAGEASGNAIPSYPYAVPSSSGDSNIVVGSYPYSLTGATASDGNNVAAAYSYAVPSGQADGSPSAVPATTPYGYGYQYFYPYLLSSMAAHTANALKAMGMSEEMANAVASHTSMSMWSQIAGSSYGYPMQYMMPSSWTRQNAWTQSPAALTPAAAPVPAQQANTDNA